MSEDNKVAERLRLYREKQGLSVDALAEKSGIEPEVIQSIEAGGVIPVLGVLARLAQTLGQRLGTFLDDQYTPDPVITRAAEAAVQKGSAGRFTGVGYVARSLAPGKSDRQMDPYQLDLSPDSRCLLSSHEGEELVICVAGQVELLYGEQTIALGPGDTAYYNSVVKHAIRAVGQPASVYGVVFMPV